MGEQQKIRPFPPRGREGNKVHVEPFRVVNRHREEAPIKHARVVAAGAWNNRERYTAQSILTGLLDTHYIPTLDEARDILAWAGRGAHA